MPSLAKCTLGAVSYYVRLCWCCLHTGKLVPTGREGLPGVVLANLPSFGRYVPATETEAAALALPGRCDDCHRRSLAGLPVGRRIDA